MSRVPFHLISGIRRYFNQLWPRRMSEAVHLRQHSAEHSPVHFLERRLKRWKRKRTLLHSLRTTVIRLARHRRQRCLCSQGQTDQNPILELPRNCANHHRHHHPSIPTEIRTDIPDGRYTFTTRTTRTMGLLTFRITLYATKAENIRQVNTCFSRSR